jgi:hypothetical protein
MAKLTKVKNFFGWIWQAIKNLFKTKYHITIYRTSESGSGAMYKSEYTVEIRSVIGLELKITEID